MDTSSARFPLRAWVPPCVVDDHHMSAVSISMRERESANTQTVNICHERDASTIEDLGFEFARITCVFGSEVAVC